MADTSLTNEIFSILSRGAGRYSGAGTGSGIDELLRPVTASLEASRPSYKGSSSMQLRASAPEQPMPAASISQSRLSSNGAEAAAAIAAAAGQRPSTVAAALQSSPHFRPTALTASPPNKPPPSPQTILALPATPQRLLRSSMSGLNSPMTPGASNASNASSAVPSPPGTMGGAGPPMMRRSAESCPGYPNPRQAFMAEESPPQRPPIGMVSPQAMQAPAGGVGSESMRSRRITTPGIVESSMLAAIQQQQLMRQLPGSAGQQGSRISSGGQAATSLLSPSAGRISSGGQPSQHRLSSAGGPSEGLLESPGSGLMRSPLGQQASFDHLLPSQAPVKRLTDDGAGGGGPGRDFDPRHRRSRRSSDAGEADEPSAHSVPFDPVSHPARGPPQAHPHQQQIGQFTFGPTPLTITPYDSPPRATPGPISPGHPSPVAGQSMSPISGTSGPSPSGVAVSPGPGERALKSIGSVRARTPIVSILQQSPLAKKDMQPSSQPTRQLAYSQSLSLRGQQEFLRQQKAEQEALDKAKEEQDKRQKEIQDKVEQEQLEADIQMYTNPRRALGYTASVAIRPSSSLAPGMSDIAAAAAAAVADADGPAAPANAPPPERVLGQSASVRPPQRGVNPVLNGSLARPPLSSGVSMPRASPPAGIVGGVAGPNVGVPPTPSRLAGIATQQVLTSPVKTPEDPEKEAAARAGQTSTQLLSYEQQLLQAKLAEIQMKKLQSHMQQQEEGDGPPMDDNASTDREEEEEPPPPSEFLLRWIEENNMRMAQKLRGKATGP